MPPQTYRYRLAPGDRLVTSVFKIEGYEAEVQVLSDGTINLPRLGTVVVWGLTLEEARQRITDGYSRFLRRPLVYLDLVEQRPVRVTVTGEVLRPGIFTLPVSFKGSSKSAKDATSVASMAGGGPPWWMWSKELAEFQRQGIWLVWNYCGPHPPLVDQPKVISSIT